MKVLVTGASGFVGKMLCSDLAASGFDVRGSLRRLPPSPSLLSLPRVEYVAPGEINSATDWSAALLGIETVVHLAARVHVMRDTASDPLQDFRAVNVAGTQHLARCAAAAGVRRFVYASTVKVQREATLAPIGEDVAPNPTDAYALSKWEAEQALHRIAAETGMEVVIVRPPLMYGPGVGANFLRLLRLVDRGIPLPFSGIDNRRSLLYVGNFTAALIACMVHPKAPGGTYLVSDDGAIATPDLIRAIGQALGRPARLFCLPPGFLRGMARLAGKADEIERLVGSLEIDSSKIRRELNWSAPYSLSAGLTATVEWYRLASQRNRRRAASNSD